MFPVTVTLHDAAQLNAVMQALQTPTVAAGKVEPPKSAKPAPEKSNPDTGAAAATTTAPGTAEVKTDPKPAAAATAPAAAAAQTASSDVVMTEADLTKVVVAAVARVGKEKVLALLQDKFNVTAGKQITDPAVRAQAKEALEAL
jgi:hypothetical protein